ncbi:sensor protein ZraS [bacterium BMS3Bbin08]|nr:sensor protein ZraS [bacterium BMS3Bbin08]
MELIALLTGRDEVFTSEIKKALKRHTVYPLRTVEEFEDLNTSISVNLLLVDTVSHRLSRMEDLLDRLGEDKVILLYPERPDKMSLEELPKSVYECVDVESIHSELPVLVERAIERQKLKNEVNLLKKARDDSMPIQVPVHSRPDVEIISNREMPLLSGRDLQEKILVSFAKMLNVSFDLRKLFVHFMDSIMEIARVSRMSVMLKDKDGFYVETNYGLDPYIADNMKLKKNSALAGWLAKTGRIMQKPANPADTNMINISSEMDFLQCTYSFPMIHKGRLIGIFNIDNKITDEPFYREELEIIYMFCNYLAAAVKDIDLYHEIWSQKEFTNNILSSMTSGMIAIDDEEKITVFNNAAAEILEFDRADMEGRDLRNLPSPLGDILYDTLVTGTFYKRHEIEIQPGNMPVGINSFRLTDEDKNPSGAGIVFSDLSSTKRLEEHQRRAEKLEAVNDLIGKIAHEVRTPLTSIQTYTQLLSDKYGDDEELQNFFSTTVIQSIYKLDSLINKLVIFSSKPDYNFQGEDINHIIDEAANEISKNIPNGYKFSKQDIENDRSVLVNADKKLFAKAISYLVSGIVNATSDGTEIMLKAGTILRDQLSSVEISIEYKLSGTSSGERQNLLKPITDINTLDIDTLETELNVPICQKVVEAHGGTLEARDEGDKSIFVIKLPVTEITVTGSPIEKGGANE